VTDKCMVVLQKHVPGPCSETYPASSNDAYQAMNIKVEEVSVLQEDDEDPLPISFPAVKADYEVSCMCVHHYSNFTYHICRTEGVFRVSSCLPFHIKKAPML
jgi:hypothetical protein